MEKKTFNDMMANLPTTETDMTKVMVEMEDGRKGWISAEGLAQVMAGLMLRPILITDFTEMDSMTYENYNAKFFCYFNSTTSNSPFNNFSGIIFSFIFGSASVCQIVITNDARIYIRSRYKDDEWINWTRIGA